jgi:chromosome segregation ATPase
VLYLAEVQKQKGKLLGNGNKTELKLLACQKTEQSWSNVSEEIIAAEEANKLNDGTLVIVELNSNRQVQRLQEAGRPLVNILQNFSRQLEKFKLKEEEIDQWKESLTFQAQELNRRELEIEASLEQVQHIEEDLQRLETEKKDFEKYRHEIEEIRTEIERSRQDLETAWENLQGEQRRMEEHQADFKAGASLDEQQSLVLRQLLERLPSHNGLKSDEMQDSLARAFSIIDNHQGILSPHWEQLEISRSFATEKQEEVDRLSQNFIQLQQEWQESQRYLEQAIADLKVNIASLKSKEDYARLLKIQLRNQEDLYQQIYSLASSSDDLLVSDKIDIESLEKIPLEELQKIIQDMQEKLEIDSSFVNDQEQELKYKQQIIDEILGKINQVIGDEHSQLETELADEKDSYQMLNETLVGQRRSLIQRQALVKQHKTILRRRQGNSSDPEQKLDLQPLLSQLEALRQQQSEELQSLEHEIEQILAGVELTQGIIENQKQEQEAKQQELQELEQNLLTLRTATAESWGRANLYQEALQPIQDNLDSLRQQLQTINNSFSQTQGGDDSLSETVAQISEFLKSAGFC